MARGIAIHRFTVFTAALLLVLLASGLKAAEPGPITIATLLAEMVDRDNLARFPSPEFRLRQASSYDRASKTPDDPKGWFANKDSGHFIRIEERAGRKEWVIMESSSPGAIVRWWMPDPRANDAVRPGAIPTDGRIRIYFDGADTPGLEAPALDLLNGSGMVPRPLGHPSLLSAVSFFSIPYAKSCKVTLDRLPFYYTVAYRQYAPGTPIRTFTKSDFDAARPLIEQTCKKLLAPPAAAQGQAVAIRRAIEAGNEASAALPCGPAAVRQLTLKLDPSIAPQVTRSLVLKLEFDGRATVWCPVGDFFGTGVGIHPFRDWWRSVEADGKMTCRWVMPYRQSGKVTLVNLGREPVSARLDAAVGGWKWDDRSLVFHANWRHQYPVNTRPYCDFNFVTLSGRGVYVGDTLTVMNPVKEWWGEGDEKIWLDGESFPSLFGTGSEDYYGYSWGSRSTAFYEHPFHVQVRVGGQDKLHPGVKQGRDTQGYSTETRVRSLDSMPFGKSLRFDMEVWHKQECRMSYAVATYWYGNAEATGNREPSPEEAARPLVQPTTKSER